MGENTLTTEKVYVPVIVIFMEDGTEYQVKNVDVSVSTLVELKLKGGKAIADMK